MQHQVPTHIPRTYQHTSQRRIHQPFHLFGMETVIGGALVLVKVAPMVNGGVVAVVPVAVGTTPQLVAKLARTNGMVPTVLAIMDTCGLLLVGLIPRVARIKLDIQLISIMLA